MSRIPGGERLRERDATNSDRSVRPCFSSTAHSVKDKLQKRKEMYEDWLSARKDLGLKGNGNTTFIADAEQAIKVSFHLTPTLERVATLS